MVNSADMANNPMGINVDDIFHNRAIGVVIRKLIDSYIRKVYETLFQKNTLMNALSTAAISAAFPHDEQNNTPSVGKPGSQNFERT